MPRDDLPASFISPHGRAKLEYTACVTTTGKRGRHSSSAIFRLLPSSKISTFQMQQQNFNVDIENGGVTTALGSRSRNIITVCCLQFYILTSYQVSCPAHLLQETLQNITITFPSDRFVLQEVVLTLTSKLFVQAAKSTFAVEENNHDIPCTLTDDSTTSKILSIRVPTDVTESFRITMKRFIVRKWETLRLVVSYGVRTSDSGLLQCTVRSLFLG
jgi:hypothetical protein